MIDLSTLPAPNVVLPLDYESIVARDKAVFVSEWNSLRVTYPDLPEYDVSMLETDPAVISIEAEAYRELRLLARINEAARARLLAFAQGGDLDQLAVFYDIMRLPGETDARLKTRVILAIQGRSTGGPEEYYKSAIMNADIRVSSVKPYRVGRSPLIYIAVYSTEANGVASESLLNVVRSTLAQKNVQLVNDEFVVASAVQTVVNLTFDIWLLTDADEATVTRAVTALRSAWSAEQALGRDLIREWWVSKLMISGVHKVVPTSPVADVIAPPFQAIAIGTITPTLRGRAF